MPRPAPTLRRAAGFSLLELLIVLVIIGLGYILMFGPSSKYQQSRNQALCARNLERLYGVLLVYATDHEGAFPPAGQAATSEEVFAQLVPQYTSETDIFFCPGRGTSRGDLRAARAGYAYYGGRRRSDAESLPLASDAQVDTRPKTVGKPTFSASGESPGNNHRASGGHVLRCDGSIVFEPPAASRELIYSPPIRLLNPRD